MSVDFAVAVPPDQNTLTVSRAEALSVHGRYASTGALVYLRDSNRNNTVRFGKVVSVRTEEGHAPLLGITLGY